MCPHCQVELGINLDFWAQGLIQLPTYELSTGGAAVQTWGSWTVHDEVVLQDNEKVTIGIASTSTDVRLKHYVVAVVHHAQVDGALYRKGAVTTVLPGAQSLERAWFYGLRLMAHYLDLSKKVVVQVLSVRAWEGWMKQKHREVFHDLRNLVTPDQQARIQPMSLTLKQINDMPGGPFTVQARMKDATKAAKEVAMSLRPEALEEELKVTDQRYQKIAALAIQRIKLLFEDKSHFLHEAKETGKKNREQAREAKKQLFLDIGNQHQDGGHAWQAKGTSLQCEGCSKRINKHWKMTDLEAVKKEQCPAGAKLQINGGQPASPKEKCCSRC